jgi:hypothetical protein
LAQKSLHEGNVEFRIQNLEFGVASWRDDVNFIKSKVKIKKSKFTGNSNNPKSKIQNPKLPNHPMIVQRLEFCKTFI